MIKSKNNITEIVTKLMTGEIEANKNYAILVWVFIFLAFFIPFPFKSLIIIMIIYFALRIYDLKKLFK